MCPCTPLHDTAIEQLDIETFAGLGCQAHGIVVLEGAKHWCDYCEDALLLPMADGELSVPLAHDERGGPFARATTGDEQTDLLISLTDEGNVIACAWARIQQDSPIRGIGIDLTEIERLKKRSGGRYDPVKLLLTDDERARAAQLWPDDPLYGYASLFAAKEAAFKATAAPLRAWYRAHDEQLLFEVRHFVMEEPGTERGTGRNGAAQEAMDRMGIARIAVHHAKVRGMALTTAVALGKA